MNLDAINPEVTELIKSSFTDEQIERIEACENLDEVIALVEAEGWQLPDELLEPVAGGSRKGLSELLLKCCGEDHGSC